MDESVSKIVAAAVNDSRFYPGTLKAVPMDDGGFQVRYKSDDGGFVVVNFVPEVQKVVEG